MRVLEDIESLQQGKIDKTQIKNNLTETTVGNVLDASQGKVLNDKINVLNDRQVVIANTGNAWIKVAEFKKQGWLTRRKLSFIVTGYSDLRNQKNDTMLCEVTETNGSFSIEATVLGKCPLVHSNYGESKVGYVSTDSVISLYIKTQSIPISNLVFTFIRPFAETGYEFRNFGSVTSEPSGIVYASIDTMTTTTKTEILSSAFQNGMMMDTYYNHMIAKNGDVKVINLRFKSQTAISTWTNVIQLDSAFYPSRATRFVAFDDNGKCIRLGLSASGLLTVINLDANVYVDISLCYI